jgi:hypothetical protein
MILSCKVVMKLVVVAYKRYDNGKIMVRIVTQMIDS